MWENGNKKRNRRKETYLIGIGQMDDDVLCKEVSLKHYVLVLCNDIIIQLLDFI